MKTSGFLIIVTMALTGCSLTQPPLAGGAPGDEVPETAEPPSRPSDSGSGPLAPVRPAAAQFIAEATELQASGASARAAAALERAIRIDSRHPEPWLALAQLRLAEGNLAQARNLALKAKALAPAGSDWRARADSVIAQTR